jgi:hypothetical protein
MSIKNDTIMTIGDLLKSAFLGKEVKIEDPIYEKGRFVGLHQTYSGKVKDIYTDGDRYSGYDWVFRFEDMASVWVSYDTEITLL